MNKEINVVGFDLMAKGGEHNLYQLGFLLNYNPTQVYLDESSKITELFDYYAIENTYNIKYQKKYKILLELLKKTYNKNYEIHILGINLIMIIYLIIFIKLNNKNIKIHLHGQIYGFKISFVKNIIWKILSRKFIFLVSNPAFVENKVFQKIDNLNYLKDAKIKCNSNNEYVFLWSNRGVKNNLTKLNLIQKGFIVYPEINSEIKNKFWLNYYNYISTMANCKYVHLGFYDDYYLYSPSGRLSEAFIHNKIIIIDKCTENINIATKICKDYKLSYIVV
jgi:hypothetical protein